MAFFKYLGKWKHFISAFKIHVHKEQSFRYDNSCSEDFMVDRHACLKMPDITFFTVGKSPTNCDVHLTESIFQEHTTSADEHYLNRSYLRESTKNGITKTKVAGLPINTSRQQAIDLGYQVDIGHVKGNEFWRTRNAAESLGWTQAQYNDFMNKRSDMYQYEEHNVNISHREEEHSSNIRKLQKEMEDYRREQEDAGNWKREDGEKKDDSCKSGLKILKL